MKKEKRSFSPEFRLVRQPDRLSPERFRVRLRFSLRHFDTSHSILIELMSVSTFHG